MTDRKEANSKKNRRKSSEKVEATGNEQQDKVSNHWKHEFEIFNTDPDQKTSTVRCNLPFLGRKVSVNYVAECSESYVKKIQTSLTAQ